MASKHAESRSEVERKRLLDVLDTLPVVIDIIRADHTVEWTNRAYREALGDNAGKHCHAGQFGRDEPCKECQAFLPLQTGKPHHWQWTIPDGRTFDIYNYPFTASDGTPAILEMDIDITGRVQAEARIQAERQQLYKVLDTLPVYVLLLDANYRVPFANRFFESRFGKSEGRRCHEYLFDRNEPCENCESYKPLKTGRPHHWYWTGPDQRDYDIYDFPFTDTDGTTMILEMGIDITESKKAEAQIHIERQRLFEVLETLPAMVCLITPDFRVPFANRSFRERFGEPQGRRCHEFCFGRKAPCEFCEAYRVLETGQPHHWKLHGPDGSVIDAYDYPFTDVDGSPLILEMAIDVTEWRKAEAGLRDANDQLAHRATQLRALAGELTLAEQRERRRMAKVLHDHLQQLLVGAKFRLTVLGRHADPVVQEATREVAQLLDESIRSSRSLTAELSPPILHEGGLIPGLEWLARSMTDKHGLLVDLSYDEDLPPMAEDVKVLLFESVRELLFNAVKHAKVGSAGLNIRTLDEGLLRITVSDAGPGFDSGKLKQAGEAGAGFGLFSIRERLDLIGGMFEIHSAPGQGSRFMLTVPLEQHRPADAAPLPAPEAGARITELASPKIGTPIRVLLADDHVVMREGLARLLGHEPDIEIVGQAADGQEAVLLARKLLPDVILMDMSMPKWNGVEATRAITNEFRDMRIIGLSMFEEEERAQALRDAGGIDYLTKSGPPEQLIAAIRRCMGRGEC